MLHFPLMCVFYSVCADIENYMDMQTLHASFFILVISITEQSTNHVAPQTVNQTVYHKLGHALITDSKARESVQDTFFPTQELSRDLIFIHVNVIEDSIPPSSCGRHSPSPGTPTNFSYSTIGISVDQFSLISVDQLLILDVISG